MRHALQGFGVALVLTVGATAVEAQQAAPPAQPAAPSAPAGSPSTAGPKTPAPATGQPAAQKAADKNASDKKAAEPKAKELPNGADRVAVARQAIPVGKSCFRMTLSDIQVGREETIASARKKLAEEYAPETARQRGLKGRLSSGTNEVVRCEHYLWLPILGQEYKCFVTATFCAR